MKNYFLFLVFAFITLPVFAEWKFETVGGVQVHYYIPKVTLAFNKNNKNNIKRS
jgi:hypothetical protein